MMTPDDSRRRKSLMSDSAIEALLAKQAITEVLYRYCRAFDRIDDALALTVWHPDGTCNYSNRSGTPDMLFRDYLGRSSTARTAFLNHSHQVANILIELDSEA